jgi:hypothetical protein
MTMEYDHPRSDAGAAACSKYYRGFASNVGQKYQIRSLQDWREKLRLKQRVL